MTKLKITAEGFKPSTLKLTHKELTKAAERTALDAAKKLQTVGRDWLVELAEVKRATAVRRVRAFKGKTWFGTMPTVAVPPYAEFTKPIRGRRGVILPDGPVKNAFVMQHGHLRGLPFQKQDDGKLKIIKRDIADKAKEAWLETTEEAPEIIQAEMDKVAARIIRRGR